MRTEDMLTVDPEATLGGGIGWLQTGTLMQGTTRIQVIIKNVQPPNMTVGHSSLRSYAL
jgi:hypothetical protein